MPYELMPAAQTSLLVRLARTVYPPAEPPVMATRLPSIKPLAAQCLTASTESLTSTTPQLPRSRSR